MQVLLIKHLEMRDEITLDLRWDKSSNCCLIRRGQRDIWREEGDVETEAEMGVAATDQGAPGATGSWKRQEAFSPRGFRGRVPCTLRTASLQNSREYISVVFSH